MFERHDPAGSNPALGTIFAHEAERRGIRFLPGGLAGSIPAVGARDVVQRPERLFHTQDAGGSIPPVSTTQNLCWP